jgi:DNA-binding NtrC family response regulator
MKTGTVLLVFEEPHDLETYGTMLRSLGYKTLMCSSQAEGIKSLETERPSFVIVSQGTRAFEGRQVLERSLQLHPKVPVLVVSQVLDVRCYLEAMNLGAIDYLEKPEPPDLAWVVDTQIPRSGAA